MNLYNYAGNNPVTFVDPSGLRIRVVKKTTIDGVNFTTDAKAQEQFLNLLQKISGLQLEFKGGYVKIKGSSGLPEYGNTLPGGLLGAALVAHMIDVDFDIDFVATSLDPVATPAAACNGNMTSAHVIDMTDILDWIDQREGAGWVRSFTNLQKQPSNSRETGPLHPRTSLGFLPKTLIFLVITAWLE